MSAEVASASEQRKKGEEAALRATQRAAYGSRPNDCKEAMPVMPLLCSTGASGPGQHGTVAHRTPQKARQSPHPYLRASHCPHGLFMPLKGASLWRLYGLALPVHV